MNFSKRQVFRTIVSSLAFMFLMGAYYAMKPNREPIFIKYMGLKNIPYFYALSSIVTLLGVFFYNYLVSRFTRTTLTRLFFVGTILLFVVFWALLTWIPHLQAEAQNSDAWNRQFGISFVINSIASLYLLFSGAYLIFLLTLFWSFNHDLHKPEEAETFYPYITFGAQFGVIAGSWLTRQLTYTKPGEIKQVMRLEDLQNWLHSIFYGGKQIKLAVRSEDLLLLSAVGLLVCWIFLEALKRFDPKLAQNDYAKPQVTGALQDIKLFFSNKYVLFIGILAVLPTLAGTLFNYQFLKLITDEIPLLDNQTSFRAEINYYMGFCNLAMCLFITPLLLRRVGPALSLCIQPLLVAFASVCFLRGVSAQTMGYFAIVLNSCYYTLYQVGKEVFYVPTDKVIRYKMKAFCDTFMFRIGDASSSMVTILYTSLVKSWVFGLSFITLFITFGWIPLILNMRKRYRELIETEE